MSIFNKEMYKNYINACTKVRDFLKTNKELTDGVDKEYKKALSEFRIYLDCKDIRMPAQKFPYNEEDKGTWKYLDVKINSSKGGVIRCKSILNSKYIYA